MEIETVQPIEWYRVTLSDGEPLKESLREFARKKEVTFGWLQVVGELENGSVAAGYELQQPEEKLLVSAEENRHVLGIGSVSTVNGGDDLEVHLHGPMGREDETLTGCWAGDPTVYRGIEILVVKLK